MFESTSLRLALALMSTFLVPVVALAKQPHSWCTTGAALVKNDPDSDANTKSILSAVCSDPDFASCCSDGGSNARWGLSCVQKGALYANTQSTLGDYCGRYAWVQGPITKTNADGSKYSFEQYYPRDFNFVALSGNASSFRDVDGPVAAKGNLVITYFNLNIARREEIALLAGGSIYLGNGTVHGAVQYGTTFSDVNVTYPEGGRPTARTSPALIDFDKTKTALVGMSQSLRDHYDVNGTAAKPYSTLTFTGSDPELNVFKIDASQLNGTTGYSFSVPAGSAALVTVTGTDPAFKYAGFGGSLPAANKLLWNFPDAKTLTLNSVGFPGSILAPGAVADLMNGSIRGTVVVASATRAIVELYSAPFQLACSGGLCLDKTWSCSSDTAMGDTGQATVIAAEAGFLEVAGGDYIAETYPRTSPKHRIWYSFQPADSAPKSKPIAVFFNGGPGAATSTVLFAFNTGPVTLDPQLTGVQKYIRNNNSWTQFANLLYIDGPATGFSYPLAEDDGTKLDIGTDMDHDAGIFLRFITRFLVRHPSLLNDRIILVAESYGGARAALMLQELYTYSTLTNSGSKYQDSQLSADLSAYFSQAFSTQAPTTTQINSRFGHQVLVEPVLAGAEQSSYLSNFPADTNCISATCTSFDTTHDPTCDINNCDMRWKWSDDLEMTAGSNLLNLTALNAALRVNAKTIEWMKASARTKAYGRSDTSTRTSIVPNSTDMIDTFGSLNSEDNYLVNQNNLTFLPYGDATSTPARRYYSPGAGLITGFDFVLRATFGVSSFITVTEHDWNVWTPAIAPSLNGYAHTDPDFMSFVSSVGYTDVGGNGLPRPGYMSINYPSGGSTVVVMPTSYDSGHQVTMRAPAELLSDVLQWYKSSPH